MRYSYKTKVTHFAGDMHTPVSLYLKLRDLFPQSALLESSDYHSNQTSTSFVALDTISSVSINEVLCTMQLPDNTRPSYAIQEHYTVDFAVAKFISLFDIPGDSRCGVFGYTAYDSVKYFENRPISTQKPEDNDAPDVLYIIYRFTLIFDHFHNPLTMIELLTDGEVSYAHQIRSAVDNRNYAVYSFRRKGAHQLIGTTQQRNIWWSYWFHWL